MLFNSIQFLKWKWTASMVVKATKDWLPVIRFQGFVNGIEKGSSFHVVQLKNKFWN